MNRVIEQLRAIVLRDGAGLTDGQLLECYLSRRDEAAFEALVRRHGSMVFGVCCRVLHHHQDSEDAFQATFLVLARKAASIVPPEMVGNWLYGVAYRTAHNAKRAAAKRRIREQQVMEMPDPVVYQNDGWHELRPLLDQELSCLPDKYRAPLLLCALEGKTEKEAARQLGWPQGTLSGRLSRAKRMLAKRLARRGLVLTAGLATGMLAQGTAATVVPASLLHSTVKAAMPFTARQAVAAGLVSADVVALTQGVLTAMFISKLKGPIALLLAAVVLVSGSGLVMSRAGGSDNPDAKSQIKTREAQESKAQPESSPSHSDKVTASSSEIGQAYLTNAAQFDEMFYGKRVAVTGKMANITGGSVGEVIYRTGPGAHMNSARPQAANPSLYYLEMQGVSWTGHSGPVPRLIFVFNPADRKHLAGLKAGQNITIEGQPRPLDQYSLQFLGCKVIQPKVDN